MSAPQPDASGTQDDDTTVAIQLQNEMNVESRAEVALPGFCVLAVELQDHILNLCTNGDLVRLAQTSQQLRDMALSMLYRHVDISYHNDTGTFTSQRYSFNAIVENNSLHRHIPPEDWVKLKTRQTVFVDKILETPPLASAVRSLTWTFRDEEGYGMKRLAQLRMWKAFQLMTQVQKLDICSMALWNDYVVLPPLSLFPAAVSIRIGGAMSYAFFRAMLSKPERFVFLELDNVQAYGQLDNERRQFYDSYNEADGLPNDITQYPETEDAYGEPLLRHTGPMRGHFHSITGRLTRLQHLHIRTVGQDDCTDDHFSFEREKKRYTEMATFVDSHRSTLNTLVLEQGIQPEYKTDEHICLPFHRGTEQLGRPMDSFFMTCVLPILTQGPWPKLEKLSIVGVGGLPRDPGSKTWTNCTFGKWRPLGPEAYEDGREKLRSAVGTADFSWETDAKHTFSMLIGSTDYSDPHAPILPWGSKSEKRVVICDQWLGL